MSYKNLIIKTVLEKGGLTIDELEVATRTNQYPEWLSTISKQARKPESQVAYDLILYRNSFKYQKAKMGIK